MALKQDGVYFIQFVLNKVINWGRFCFLNGVRVSKPPQPTYIKIKYWSSTSDDLKRKAHRAAAEVALREVKLIVLSSAIRVSFWAFYKGST